MTGASSLHVQLFDVGDEERDTMAAAGGRVIEMGGDEYSSRIVVEMDRQSVVVDAFAPSERRNAG